MAEAGAARSQLAGCRRRRRPPRLERVIVVRIVRSYRQVVWDGDHCDARPPLCPPVSGLGALKLALCLAQCRGAMSSYVVVGACGAREVRELPLVLCARLCGVAALELERNMYTLYLRLRTATTDYCTYSPPPVACIFGISCL